MHACIMKSSVEFEIRLPFTHPCIPKCVEDNWVYLLEFFWSYWHKIIVCSYVETVLISSKCSNLLLPQILWDPYLPPLSSSDRQSGVLALICELMDMNIYELIKGTASQKWFTTWAFHVLNLPWLEYGWQFCEEYPYTSRVHDDIIFSTSCTLDAHV